MLVAFNTHCLSPSLNGGVSEGTVLDLKLGK